MTFNERLIDALEALLYGHEHSGEELIEMITTLRQKNSAEPKSAETPDSHAGLSAEQILAACDANENCISDMACPKCGHYEAFEIMATRSAMTYVFDDGTDDFEGDNEWSDTSDCRCPNCNHTATVGDFCLSDVALARANAFLTTTEQ